MKRKTMGRGFGRDVEAMWDIVWQRTEYDWFELSMCLRLHFFHFPKKYRTMARDRFPIFFTGPKTTYKQAQATNMKPDEKVILKDELGKTIRKKYLTVTDKELDSSIKYFGSSQGCH